VMVAKNSPNPHSVDVPRGIDPGFAYTPGKSTFEKHKKDIGL